MHCIIRTLFIPPISGVLSTQLVFTNKHKHFMVPAYTQSRQDDSPCASHEATRMVDHKAGVAAGSGDVDKTPAPRGDALRGTSPAVPSESVPSGSRRFDNDATDMGWSDQPVYERSTVPGRTIDEPLKTNEEKKQDGKPDLPIAEKNPLFVKQQQPEDYAGYFQPLKMSTEKDKNLYDMSHEELIEYAKRNKMSSTIMDYIKQYTLTGKIWCTSMAALANMADADFFLKEKCGIPDPLHRSRLFVEAHQAAVTGAQKETQAQEQVQAGARRDPPRRGRGDALGLRRRRAHQDEGQQAAARRARLDAGRRGGGGHLLRRGARREDVGRAGDDHAVVHLRRGDGALQGRQPRGGAGVDRGGHERHQRLVMSLATSVAAQS